MLYRSSYPPRLKERIAGRYGHLSNVASAEILQRVASARLQRVVAAHLSKQNNRPDLARAAFAAALGSKAEDIFVASQDQGLQWVTIA